MYLYCLFSVRPNKKKDEKILRQYPQMKDLVIKLCRDPEIEVLARNVGPPKRQSVRVMKLAMKPKQSVAIEGNRTPTKKNLSTKSKSAVKLSTNAHHSTPKARQSTPIAILRSAQVPKSILKGASRLRNRSKSVSFDINHGSPIKGRNTTSVCRTLFSQNSTPVDAPSVSSVAVVGGSSGICANDIPMDLTTGKNTVAVADPTIDFSVQPLSTGSDIPVALLTSVSKPPVPVSTDVSPARTVDEVAEYAEISTGENVGYSSSSTSQILAYEHRIDGLIDANRAKVRRIKELLAERSGLLAEIENLHRINRSLAETVDMYREQDENDPVLNGNDTTTKLQQQIDQLQGEISSLRMRVDRSNRQIFGLKEDNEKLKTALSTHTKKVLSEHNYNL